MFYFFSLPVHTDARTIFDLKKSRVTGSLILIGSLGCLKEVKTMDMIHGKCKLPNSFLPYFQ